MFFEDGGAEHHHIFSNFSNSSNYNTRHNQNQFKHTTQWALDGTNWGEDRDLKKSAKDVITPSQRPEGAVP